MPKKKVAAAKNGATGTKASRSAARTLAFARSVFEAAPIGLAAYDHTGQCVAVNEAAAATVGATVEQLLVQNFRKLESWKRSGLLAAAEEALATGRGRRLEAHVTTGFSRTLFLDVRFETFGSNGDRHLLMAFHEFAAPEGPEPEPVRSYGDRQFEQIFDLSAVGKSLTAPDGRLLRVNRALGDMLGYTREELQSTNFAAITHPDDVAASRELIRCLLAGERETITLEKRYLHKNGSIVWTAVHSALLRDDRGAPQCLVTSIVDLTARKRAEEALLEGAAKLQQTFEEAPVGEVMVGLDKRFLHANKSFCAFLGYREEELLGKTIADVTHPADRDLGMADLRAIVSGEKKTAHTRKRYVRKDGSVVWGDVTMALVRDAQGRPAYFLPTIQDITERVRTEEAVARYSRELTVRNRIAQILLTTPGDDMYFDVLQVVLEVMQSPYGVFGYIDECGALVVPTMTRHVWDKCDIPDKTLTFPRENWGDSAWPTAVREKRVIVSNEPSTKIPPGHVPIRRHISFPIRFQDNVIGLLQVANKDSDYTKEDVALLATMADTIAPVLDARLARARREEALRDAWERLEEAQAVALVGNWEWDAIADVITGSTEFYRLFDVPAAQLARFSQFIERLHPDDRKRVEGDVADALRRDRPYDTDYRVRLRDGGWRDLNARGRTFADRDGKPLRMVGTCQDITERKAMEAALRTAKDTLERSNKELEQFAYVASHDLQEPLRMISSYTQLLAQRYGEQLDDQAKKFIGYAVDGAVRMQRQINDLLTYSRVGTRGKPLEPTDTQAVLGEALRNLMAAIEEQHAMVVTDDLPTVRADAAQLVLVFQNLIANAIKFHGAQAPRVRVSARDGGKEWVFAVQDNGIGIEPQYADRLFVIFQRLHTREEYPGSGIGLAICRRIVERHGGRIWFESAPDKGATFFFTVPKQEG